MSKSKREEEREWKVRKESQKPHGKVKSLEEIADEIFAEWESKR
ncbi:hypothetical protein BpJC7_00530 [Weizmannia acidilactici]|uniref:Uncharacterized protein n=1 Tax=Weizmannia acidilactici TaxID=2607726 RepID=A0A5J4JE99_9BACI|nr:DUF6254 family protein [Weizmannia acidilactici]GER67449.1 hypothetical protein BpJC4_19200 [Weizmannia acidilactici]GER68750.1 hypothetical protein BpJC7_00530 [Weizmannia acidilactici]GER72965.1 hypothetical protein BpPP18_10320 [Weizmannia acidilactici]